jgi:putative flippase GtrA
MVFDESFFKEDSRMLGVGWAREIIEHNLITRVVNFQLKRDAGHVRGGVVYAMTGTQSFLVGTMALYRRDYWLDVMQEHPCTPYGEDYFTGSIGLHKNYRLAFDLRSTPSTFSPPVVTGLCSSYEREQGYGAATLFKQRALRWSCTSARTVPFLISNMINYEAGDFTLNAFYRWFSFCRLWNILRLMLSPILLVVICVELGASMFWALPSGLTAMYITGVIRNLAINYILWHGAVEHQASCGTLLYASFMDIVLNVFTMIGTYKCLLHDIWHPKYKWNVGCWKNFKHLTLPAMDDLALDETQSTSSGEVTSMSSDGVEPSPSSTAVGGSRA